MAVIFRNMATSFLQKTEAGAGQDADVLLIALPAEKTDHFKILRLPEGCDMVFPVHPDAIADIRHVNSSFSKIISIILRLAENGIEGRRT
jgi:hypothetical protein